jgi:hypothetical protein
MYRSVIISFLLASAIAVKARAQSTSATVLNTKTANNTFREAQPYGKVDQEDLDMKQCDFEKEANAEVLFDVGKIDEKGEMERHLRLKVFNEAGKNYASFSLEYPAANGGYSRYGIFDLKGETINMEDGKMVITPLDGKLVYTQKINSSYSALTFAFPNVKAGSIVEFKYRGYFPQTWYFQNNIPTRYSEIQSDLPSTGTIEFKVIPHVTMPYAKSVGSGGDYTQIKALANVPSLPDEPFMDSKRTSFQRIEYVGIMGAEGSWQRLGEILSYIYDRDQWVDSHVPGEDEIISQAKKIKTDNDKINFIFNYVRDYLKWNGVTDIGPSNTTDYTWKTKSGNSADINWIVYHLLKKSGITSYPLITSLKERGKINPFLPDILKMDNMLVYIPVDSTTNYVLDASDKYNSYNVIPRNNLNTFGLKIDRANNEFKMVFIDDESPVMQQAFFNSEITPDGKMTGTAEITSDSYNRYKTLKDYDFLGEQKYTDSLRNKDNNIKITSFKMENMEVDSLPLVQKVGFTVSLTGADENYIYFGTNLFALLGDNPFKSEKRFSDIDFGYRRDYSISCVYKLPAGYKVDALPKPITVFMPDKSILFKRTVVEDNGTILVRYLVDHRKTIYFIKDYPDVRSFYKKMYELLNEQIVLKKG